MSHSIQTLLKTLVQFGINNNLLLENDKIYTENILFCTLNVKHNEDEIITYNEKTVTTIMDKILDYAVANSIIEDTLTFRDLLNAKLMGLLMGRPSEIIKNFQYDYNQDKKLATTNFYNINKAINYIQVDRINKNLYWETDTEYGKLEITVNLSKPEKDPKEIMLAKNAPQSNYPKCMLCRENIGFEGNVNHPARQNLRIIPVSLNNEKWNFQYSPYVYYNEHCIIFNDKHTPMKINENTFVKLLDFVDFLPHYFAGSNADLPIVGGSILSHDHFQGGNHQFPMEVAPNIKDFKYNDFNIGISIVKWPMSVIRLSGEDKNSLVKLSSKILENWRNYSDEEREIQAFSNDIPHNTITPIGRINKQGQYEIDLVLRNNRTTDEHPLGIFHPHNNLHHIKKENIGLIEVMGLAVLPGRLDTEIELMMKYLKDNTSNLSKESGLIPHINWLDTITSKTDVKELTQYELKELLQNEIGLVFKNVLEDAGVYKNTEDGIKGFVKFMHHCNFVEL